MIFFAVCRDAFSNTISDDTEGSKMKLFATLIDRFIAIERLQDNHRCVAAVATLALIRSIASVLAVDILSDLFSAIGTVSYTTQLAMNALLWLVVLEVIRTGALWLRMRIANSESGRIYRKLLRRCIASGIEREMSSNELATVASHDVRSIAEDGFSALENSGMWMISLAVHIVYGLIVNPIATAALILLELGVIWSIKKLNDQLDVQNEARRQSYGKWFELLSAVADKMEACMACLNPEKLLAMLEKRAFQWNDESRRSLDTLLRVDGRFRAGRLLGELIIILSGVVLWMNGSIDVGTVYASIVTAQKLCDLFEETSDVLDDLTRCQSAVKRFEQLCSENFITVSSCGHHMQSALELNNVSFSYSGELVILDGINAVFEFGQMYAIVGTSGCGKSTLLKVIGGFLRNTGGFLTLDCRAYTEMTREELWASIQYCAQPAFIEGSFRDNVLFGQPMDEEQFKKACTGCEEFLQRDAIEGAWIRLNGDPLSSGERQRIVIARQIYRNSPLLLLDEPFSNVSVEVERACLAQLRAQLAHACVIVATHRTQTLDMFDKVLTMKGGQLYD